MASSSSSIKFSQSTLQNHPNQPLNFNLSPVGSTGLRWTPNQEKQFYKITAQNAGLLNILRPFPLQLSGDSNKVGPAIFGVGAGLLAIGVILLVALPPVEVTSFSRGGSRTEVTGSGAAGIAMISGGVVLSAAGLGILLK